MTALKEALLEAGIKPKTEPEVSVYGEVMAEVGRLLSTGLTSPECVDRLVPWVLQRQNATNLMIRRGCADIVGDAASRVRHCVGSGTLSDKSYNKTNRALDVVLARLTILDWRIPSTQVALRDATAADLVAAIDSDIGRSEFLALRASKLRRVQEGLAKSGKTTVGEAFTEKQLTALLQGVTDDEV